MKDINVIIHCECGTTWTLDPYWGCPDCGKRPEPIDLNRPMTFRNYTMEYKPMTKWYDTHYNLVGLAEWLNSECCHFPDASAVIYYFEKPWKWTREFELWQLAQRGFCTERCIEAVDDPRMTADQLEAEEEERNETV